VRCSYLRPRRMGPPNVGTECSDLDGVCPDRSPAEVRTDRRIPHAGSALANAERDDMERAAAPHLVRRDASKMDPPLWRARARAKFSCW
jgi:hypothetical protein